MARRKIVFVLVEGPSDDTALGLFLNKLYDQNKVYIYITHGDITTAPHTNPATILKQIGDLVRSYAQSNHFSEKHFQEIVHILDMDGAYIPDSAVVKDEKAENPVYTLAEIRTRNVDGICARNRTKQQCLDRLSQARSVWKVPYQAYYMSCNLDHVLYDKQNSDDTEKETDARSFSKKYKDDLCGFVHFLCDSDFSIIDDYVKSWNFIKEGTHSLERHTNFGICLQRVIENAGKQTEAQDG